MKWSALIVVLAACGSGGVGGGTGGSGGGASSGGGAGGGVAAGGAMLDPWIFRKLQHAASNCDAMPEPSPDEQIDFLSQHFYLMVEQHQEHACLQFRKFAAWYGARLGVPEDLEDRLRRFEDYGQFDLIVQEIRQRHGERKCSIPTALIKVPNGPAEHW